MAYRIKVNGRFINKSGHRETEFEAQYGGMVPGIFTKKEMNDMVNEQASNPNTIEIIIIKVEQ